MVSSRVPGRRHRLQVSLIQREFNQETTEVICGYKETLKEEAIPRLIRTRFPYYPPGPRERGTEWYTEQKQRGPEKAA